LSVTFMNCAAEELLGWKLREARGRRVDEIVQLQDEVTGAALPALMLEALWSKSSCHVASASLVTRYGSIRHVSQSAAPVIVGNTLVGGVVAINDLTDQRRNARELEVADRMSSLARHSKTIGHDVNNALAIVGANLMYISEQLDAWRSGGLSQATDDALDESKRAIVDANTGVDRIEQIVSRLRMFSEEDSAALSVDPSEILRWALGATERLWSSRARLVLDLGRMPQVAGDEARVGQLFFELVTRAARAIAPDDTTGHEIGIRGRRDEQGRAVIFFSTTGTPVDDDVRPGRAGGAPKRTRATARSVLAMCSSLVHELGGEILLEPRPDRGDVVRVTLPAAQTVRLRPRRNLPEATGPYRRGRVLVIDDEELVGQVVTRVLSDEHDVVAVHSAAEAMDLLRRGLAFDAIVCDLVMPTTGGAEMYDWIRTHVPSSAGSFMFMTGGPVDPETAEVADAIPVPRMRKPFEPAELRKLVAALVSRRS
jgi:signal transduction histidine kinase